MQKRVNQKGFTLVELVVVIAVLAILAGVGVVAYNGYIDKAREAADIELLGAVNTAFASACAEEGIPGLPASGAAELSDGKISVVGYGLLENKVDTNLTDTFMQYYEGNENATFKVFKELGYSKGSGFIGLKETKNGIEYVFSDGSSLKRRSTDIYGNTTWEWKKDGETYEIVTKETDIVNFNGSNFSKNMTMEELMGEIQQVTDAATVVFRNIMGADVALTKEMQDKLADLGYKPGTPEYNKAAMNALVLQVAKQSSIYSADDIIAYMKKEVNSLDSPVSGEGDGMLAVAAAPYAAQYALITAFVNSPGGRDVQLKFHDESLAGDYVGTLGDYYDTYFKDKLNSANASQATGAISKLTEALRNNADYQEYLNEGSGKADLEGYFSALSMVRDNSDEFIRSGVIDQGYGDENTALTEMLSALFGGEN